MYQDGKLITSGEEARLHSGLFGVRKYIPEKCENGFTLFSNAWGYTEYLIDMRGLVVHRWPVTHSNVAELLPNGNLLTHNDPGPLGRGWIEELAPDGSVLWRWEGEERLGAANHHDFYRVSEDELVLLAWQKESVIEKLYRKDLKPDYMRTDLVLRINPLKGKILWEFSLSDHLEELCELAGLPLPIPYFYGKRGEGLENLQPRAPADWCHTNTVEVLPSNPSGEKDGRFQEGNILLSFRNLDTIAIIDPVKESFVWCYGLGVLDGQHQPTMLDNGHILVFDNGTYRGYSVVWEIDPLTEKIVWEYKNQENFFSPFRSGVQRLTNGNTLITECDAGHIFEVTPTKEIVWDFYSPFVGQGPHHLGKRIHRSTRYSHDYVEALLESRQDEIVAEVDREGKPVKNYKELIELYLS